MRISTNLTSDTLRYSMTRRDDEIEDIQTGIAKSSRLNKLQFDPADASSVTRLNSKLYRFEEYEKNLHEVGDRLNLADGAIQEGIQLIQRIREISIQGANGTNSRDDMMFLAQEVDQYLREMVKIGNDKDGQGKALFAGNATLGTAYSTEEGRVEGLEGSFITDVRYLGDNQRKKIAVDDNHYLDSSRPGSEVFWADNNSIYSQTDSQNYVATEDTFIKIDEKQIDINQGDNVYAIIDKINNANVSVRASLDPDFNGLILQATEPHQIWVDEPLESSTLKDLGVIQANGTRPPNNLANNTVVTGGNLFDTIIQVRDALAKGDHEALGSRGIYGIDQGLKNLTKSLSDIGATVKRSHSVLARHNSEILTTASWASRKNDLNMAKAIVRLKELEAVQQATYQVAGKILQSTLMDYIR